MKNVAFALVFGIAIASCGKAPDSPQPAAVPPAMSEALPSTFPEVIAARDAGKLDRYEGGLKLLTRSSDESTRARSLSMLALFYEQQKRYDEAIESFMQASNVNREIAPFLGVHLAEALAAKERFGEAVSIANQIIAIAPGTAAATDARLALPLFYARAGDLDRARTALAQTGDIAVDEFTERRLVSAADAAASAGLTAEANALRKRLLTTRPQGRYTEKLYGQLTSATPSPLLDLSFTQSLDLADRLGRVNRYDQALDLLDRIEARFHDEAGSPYFRYVRLRSLFNSRNYTKAVAIELSPEEPYYLASQLLRARAFWRTSNNTEFLRLARGIVEDAPKSKEALEAKLLLSKYYVTDEPDAAKATSYLEAAVADGANGSEGENLWSLGWTYVVAGRNADALRTFDRYLSLYPDSDYTTNSLFWSGKVRERLGDLDGRNVSLQRLIASYPYAYYSYRAREIIGDKTVPGDDAPGGKPFPDINAPESHDIEMRLGIVHKLLDAGLGPEAARELRTVAAAAPDDAVLAFHMAGLYAESGEPLKAMETLQRRFRETIRHGGTGVPHRFWELLYPRGYWREIEAGAAKASLDPYMAASIIRQESAFDPTVVSNAGAVGLMQIMPAELSKITAAAGLAPATRDDLFDPARNTEIGAAEFQQKVTRVNGNRLLAIAAYNAGEDAVNRWLAKTPLDDVDFFVESIPYAETRLYVKNVTRNLYEYKRIYEPAPAAPKP